MISKENLAGRVRKAKSAKVETLYGKTVFCVKGSRDYYNVQLRDGEKPARAICRNERTGAYCAGNQKSVCYHVIAALLARAAASKVMVAFCANRDDAERLSRIGGTFHRCQNGLASTEVWFVGFKNKAQSEVDAIQANYLKRSTDQILDAIVVLERKRKEMPWSILVKKELKRHQDQLVVLTAQQ